MKLFFFNVHMLTLDIYIIIQMLIFNVYIDVHPLIINVYIDIHLLIVNVYIHVYLLIIDVCIVVHMLIANVYIIVHMPLLNSKELYIPWYTFASVFFFVLSYGVHICTIKLSLRYAWIVLLESILYFAIFLYMCTWLYISMLCVECIYDMFCLTGF